MKEHGLKGGFFGSRARGGCDVVKGWVGGAEGAGQVLGTKKGKVVPYW